MKGTRFTQDVAGRIDRRTLLKLTGGAAGGSLAVTAVGSADHGGRGRKSGGRGQTSSDVTLEEPFSVSNPRKIRTNASCNSNRSEQQDYTRYDFEYCDGSGGGTICVIPHQAQVDLDRVYEFRSKQECKEPPGDFQYRFSFGPSNSEHDCDE